MTAKLTPSRQARRAGALLLLLCGLLALDLFGAPPGGAQDAPGGDEPAQDADAPRFRGTLEDKKGTRTRSDDEPVAGVVIIARDASGEQVAETTSAEDGSWELVLPGPGTFTAEIDADTLPSGLALTERDPRPVTVNAGESKIQIFELGARTRNQVTTFDRILQLSFAGVRFGLIIAITSVGLSLIFGTTGLTNFAHAEMVTFGAIIALWMWNLGLPILLAIVVAVIASGLFGWSFDAALWRPLRRRGIGLVQMMILTIGASLAGRYIFLIFIGGGTSQLPGTGGVRHQIFGPVKLSTVDMVSMGLSLLVLLAVSYWLLRTRIGKATRAVADNRQLASASGIDVESVTRIVWVIGGALAGLSGVLWAYFRPGIKWDMGVQILLLIFAAVVLGGLGTAFGALIGSLVIGILVEVSTLWIPSDIKYVGALGVLVIVLLFRPQGLLGRRERVG